MSFFRSCRDSLFLWVFVIILASGCALLRAPDHANNVRESECITVMNGNESAKQTESEPGQLQLHAKYAVLIDAENRRVLYAKNADRQAAMASTTKIMTLLVALENSNPDDVITISTYAASMPEVKLGVRPGEQYRMKDLLYALMLESHNDVAVAIAEHVAGSVERFAELMNQKAAELGAAHTHFVTPNGLDAEAHYTTAYDMACIAACALQNEQAMSIMQTSEHSFHEQTKGRGCEVHNKNRFLSLYEGALGLKTGFTGNAGYCFVGAAKRGDKTLVSVVLASGWPPHKTYKWEDTIQLMEYGMQQYERKQIVKKGTMFRQVPVNGSVEDAPVTAYVDRDVELLLRADEKTGFEIQLPDSLNAPVRKDAVIGKLVIRIEDRVYQILPLYSAQSRNKITYGYVIRQLLRQYMNY